MGPRIKENTKLATEGKGTSIGHGNEGEWCTAIDTEFSGNYQWLIVSIAIV